MKKIILIAFIFICTTKVSQAQTKIQLGASSGLGFNFHDLYFGGLIEFKVNDHFSVIQDFLYYIPKPPAYAYEINSNVAYYFKKKNNLLFYGLAGWNLTHIKVPDDFDFNRNFHGRVGLNFGAGLNYVTEKKIVPFVQLKYVVSNYHQGQVAIGMKIKMN